MIHYFNLYILNNICKGGNKIKILANNKGEINNEKEENNKRSINM